MIPYWQEPVFELAGRTVHGWGFMVSLGIALGFLLALRRARGVGVDRTRVAQLGVTVVVSGFLVAHFVHVLAYDPGLFRERASSSPDFDWWSLLRVTSGYSSFGGFLGAALGVLLFRAITKIRLLDYADPVLYGFVPAWMLGRVGCFLAHDHRGERSDFFLAVDFPTGARHDLGLYEAILAAVLWAGLVTLDRRGLRHLGPGLLIAIYALARFAFEELRWRDARYLGLTPAQYGAIPLLLVGIAFVVIARRRAAAAHG